VTDLLDVNVLVSLAWPNHVHHEAAQKWFRTRDSHPWATTPITESGFVRVSSNRSALLTAVTPAEAWALLERIRGIPEHVFLPDDVERVFGDGGIDPLLVVSHRLVTDAHLLAVARRHGARLATLDRGVRALSPSGGDEVVLVPATR
jgi:hypothetical protein